MRYITFDFLGQYRHGAAYLQFLRLRKRFFVDVLDLSLIHISEPTRLSLVSRMQSSA